MNEGHKLHETSIPGRGAEPAGAFAIEELPAPDGTAMLVLRGELDLAAAPALRGRVDAAAGRRGLIVDLAGATFIDSAVLKELLRAGVELARHDTRLVLAAVAPPVRRLLDLTRTADLFTLADDREDALRRILGAADGTGKG
jgi:anti-sigma B factor antagonist